MVGVAVFLFVGLFFFTIWMQHRLERMVAAQSKGVYRLHLHGLETSPFLGSLSVDSLILKPDHERWQQLSKQGQKVPRTLLELRTGTINLRKLSYTRAFLKQEVRLDELVVQQPTLLLSVMQADTTPAHQPLHETAEGFLQGLAIGKINVRQANLYYRDGTAPDTLFSLRSFQLAVDDFRLDSASFLAKGRAYYGKKYKLAGANAHVLFPDEFYKLSTDSINVDTQAGELLLQSIKIVPLAEPAAMARAKGEAVTHQEAEAAQVWLKGIDFGEHSRHNTVRVKYALLQSPTLTAFKDKQNFQDKGRKKLPHELVQSIKTPFLIDSLELKSGYIRYAELVPEAAERGHITFHHLNAGFSNISNIKGQVTREKPTIVKASTKVMDRALLEVTIRLPLLDENGFHTLEGTIGETNLQMLNPILMPTGFVRVESGHVTRGKFRVELNKAQANGSMHLHYNNLKLDLLTKGTGGEQSFGKKVLSKVADKVAIKDSNPSKGEKPRQGTITVTRDPGKSVFSYWKDCLSSGFMSSMGLEGMAEQ
ncbi:hypothetical protein A3841_10200 [Pontibacter flavimaris]|uniref:DUF748 domain-containing protein n=1 Tax=Pontibacter flavimaris TaxID=1797110 RepID=A0A1Q5PGW7_9BACT|nr:hypothetical protein A3841_10200 [Pontibacter flavimaris]